MAKFPKKIYVTQEEGGDGTKYLQLNERLDEAAEIGSDKEVAIYKRIDVKKIVVTVEVGEL